MQDRYNESQAIRALRVFKSAISDDSIKEKLKNSNKTLVLLTLAAYFGKCSKVKLSRALPVASIETALEDLVNAGYLVKTKEGRDVYFEFKDKYEFNSKIKFNKYNPYLFANALMNISMYIKDYKIKSWNTISMMLEIAMKCNFEKDCTVQLDKFSIESISGAETNKMNLRKTLEHMGVIKGVTYRNGGNYVLDGKFKVNKDAYIFEIR